MIALQIYAVLCFASLLTCLLAVNETFAAQYIVSRKTHVVLYSIQILSFFYVYLKSELIIRIGHDGLKNATDFVWVTYDGGLWFVVYKLIRHLEKKEQL